MDRVVGQSRRPVSAGDLAGERRAHRSVDVADRQLDPDRLLPVQGAPRERHDLVVEGLPDLVLLRADAVQRAVPPVVGRQEHGGEVEPLRLPVLDRRLDLQQVDTAHHLVERAEPELRHVFAQLLGDEAEEALDVLGRAAEARAQDRVLGRHPHRAGVQVALPHHDAPEGHEHRRAEPELLGPHQRRDGEVPAGLQLPVDLHPDPVAQAGCRSASAGSRPGRAPTAARCA